MTTSSFEKDEDFNELINSVVLSEKLVVDEAFAQGLEKGSKDGTKEGYHLGIHRSLELGFEIGYYHGVVSTLLKLDDEKAFEVSDKILVILQKLQRLLAKFPRVNCSDSSISEQKEEIKCNFRRLCSLLKFDGLVFEGNFSF